MYRLNTAGQHFTFQGIDATTGGIKSGVSWTVRRCIDGTFAAAGGTATEDGSTGWYKFAMSQADTNGADIGFNFTGTGAVPQTVNILTTAADPSDTVRFGLTALPAVASGSAGAIPTVGTGTAQISLSSGQVLLQSGTGTGQLSFTSGVVQADVAKINAVATTSVTTINANVGTTQPVNFTGTGSSAYVKSEVEQFAAGVGPLSPIRTGTCQAGSTSTTIVLDSGSSSTSDFYNNDLVYTTGGTGAGQARKILDYVGSTRTATVRAWSTTPDNTTTFAILPDTSAWDDVTADHLTAGSTGFTLNAGGDPWSIALPGSYGAGTAGRIVGRSLPDVTAGSAKGLHILGTNVGDTNYTGVANSAMTYTGASGVPAVLMQGFGNNATGLQIDGGSGSSSAGIVVLGKTGASINGLGGAGVVFAGTTFSINTTGAVSMANAGNSIVLGTTEEGVIAGAVWDVVIASHLTAGTTGKALNTTAAAGDPWATAIPGAYSAGTAGFIVGTNLNATVSSRLAPTVASRTLDVTATGGAGIDWANVENQSTSVTLSGTTINAVTTVTVPTAAQIATAVWQDATAGDFTTSGSIGQSLFTGVAPGGSGGYVKIGTNTGNLTLSGVFTASNASNAITLGTAQDTAGAVAWGASVIGNSRTRDMFLQGMTNKVAFEVPGAGQYTLYATDDSTSLVTGTYTASAVDPVITLNPA